jgi:hypothetical protein
MFVLPETNMLRERMSYGQLGVWYGQSEQTEKNDMFKEDNL